MPKSAVSIDRITISQAARHFNRSTSWLRRLCQRGKISAQKIGPYWLVDPNEVAGWIASEPHPGRPPQPRT